MKKIVICGARSGRYPLEILAREPSCALTVHAYDAYQARKIREDLRTVGASAEILLAPNLPPDRTWDQGHFFADPKLMSNELQLDCLQDLLLHVPSGNVAGVDKPTKKKILSRTRDFKCTWEASVPGGEKHSFVSYPGCFCHRRPDNGGLALAEVVAKDILKFQDSCPVTPSERRDPLCAARSRGWRRSADATGSSSEFDKGPSSTLNFLDIGCGCGFVGLLVAKSVSNATVHLTSVDSHTRAIQATTENAQALGVACDAVLSDVGTPPETDGTFDMVAMNPPYYGDWSIAELFFATAKRALKPGGVCYAVAKNEAGLRKEAEKHFSKIATIPRRGYAVLKCTP